MGGRAWCSWPQTVRERNGRKAASSVERKEANAPGQTEEWKRKAGDKLSRMPCIRLSCAPSHQGFRRHSRGSRTRRLCIPGPERPGRQDLSIAWMRLAAPLKRGRGGGGVMGGWMGATASVASTSIWKVQVRSNAQCSHQQDSTQLDLAVTWQKPHHAPRPIRQICLKIARSAAAGVRG